MEPHHANESLVMIFLPLVPVLLLAMLGVGAWLLMRPRMLRVGESVRVWAGADYVPATVTGGTRSRVYVLAGSAAPELPDGVLESFDGATRIRPTLTPGPRNRSAAMARSDPRSDRR